MRPGPLRRREARVVFHFLCLLLLETEITAIMLGRGFVLGETGAVGWWVESGWFLED
jgi:hypothetical protein